MKERPILMSAPMVRATLDGTKTQTRRIVKGRWLPTVQEVMQINGKWVWSTVCYDLTTPYGQPGDRLWVRETHIVDDPKGERRVVFRADYRKEDLGPGWTPSILMPRWASRITLEVTDVRVQRLQEISEEDAKAEGIETGPHGFKFYGELEKLNQWTHTPVWSYETLWESINGPGSWALNPWVWSITFKRISP